MAAPITALRYLVDLVWSVLVFFSVRIELSDRLYRALERIALSLESIDQTLKSPQEDFSTEDDLVKAAAEQVAEAKDRIPHGT